MSDQSDGLSSEQAEYYAKNVDCQVACPAGTNVPEYIRLIAEGDYTGAYLVNRKSNVFPGVLGRVCDRPCEPACRRGRLENEEPVAICRLKRVAADFKGDIAESLYRPTKPATGKSIALIGAGPASLTVANDLLPLGYRVTVFEKDPSLGGAMRRAVPGFRLPIEVLEEEIGFIVSMGLEVQTNTLVQDLEKLQSEFDAVFVGSGAPLGKDLLLPGRDDAADQVQVGLQWLASVSFGHITTVPSKVLVIGGGNTAMDCCRTALRLGAREVHVAAPEAFAAMLALPWEKADALEEGVTFHNDVLPIAYDVTKGALQSVRFQKLKSLYDAQGQWKPVPESGSEGEKSVACELVILAIGQKTAYDFIKPQQSANPATLIPLTPQGLPLVDPETFRAGVTNVFFGGDAAFGPKNIITAVAQGHEAALSIHLFLTGHDVVTRPLQRGVLQSQKMGLHEWSFGNAYSGDKRVKVPHLPLTERFKQLTTEVELGFDPQKALKEAERCLNCDIQTVFTDHLCIECDACVDICPTDCLTIAEVQPSDTEVEIKQRLKAPCENPDQNLYLSSQLKTGRIMVKDENVCLHCSLCAERCPTGAWDMQKLIFQRPQAGDCHG